MGGSDSETEVKKDKKDKGKDKDKKDEKKDKGKDKDKDEKKDKKDKDKDKDEKKDKKDKDKDKKDKDKDKDEKKKDKDKDHDKGKDKDKDKKDKKDGKDKKDKKDEDEDEDDGEDGKKKKKKDKDKDKVKDKDKPSQPAGTKVSSGPVIGGEAANYYNPSGAPSQPSQPHSQPAQPSQSGEVPWFLREPGTEPVHDQRPPRTEPDFPNPNPQYTTFQQPPQQQPSRAVGGVGVVQPVQNVPPSGYRIPLDPNSQFPSPDLLGRPPTTDFNGSTGPVFIGSAIFPDSVQPCKIVPSLQPSCRVPYGGSEVAHHGRYDLLPITQDMEWVPAKNGQTPPGRRPVEGGYESNASKLYHALGSIQGVHVPGKAGEHLVSRSGPSILGKGLTITETFQRGASILFRGSEYSLQENYSIL